MRKKVREMRQKSPKDYWNYVNSLNKKNKNPDIKLDNLFEFFKTINNIEHDDSDTQFENVNNDLDSEILNRGITQDEILSCIQKLKNGKCPGLDNIMNEYIKISAPLLISVYVKLFNIIFDSGCIPESWLIGVIKPIYKKQRRPKYGRKLQTDNNTKLYGKAFHCRFK